MEAATKQALEVPPSESIQSHNLDPSDWPAFRALAHEMLDDMLDYVRDIRQRPVWRPIPEETRAHFRNGAVPLAPSPLADVHQEFLDRILPYAVGNVHPGFMGWVHGGGTPVGMLAEMLAAGLNANLGGRDQIPIEVERQVARWMQEIFGFPKTAAGLFVIGTSMANFIAMVVARNAAIGADVRAQGVTAVSKRLTAYASSAVHGCINKALELCGLGASSLRLIPTDVRHRIDLRELEKAIARDREAGCHPFLIVGTAGTVDTGAIDDLAGLADVARRNRIWFHVDGAYGALAMLAPDLAPRLAGIERADSLAFDFHKWGQVPYDAGFILVRDGERQRDAFAASSAYLRRETRGLAAGSPWPCEYGPDLSRGFRALKTWFTLKTYGTRALGSVISQTCELARYLEQRIAKSWEVEILAPVELNIVCFRYRADDSDRVNAEIVADLQESGVAAPSTTIINGKLAIRAAIVNHRTTREDIDRLLEHVVALGRKSRGKSSDNTATDASTPRAKWERNLAEVEQELESNPGSIDLRIRRGFLLSELGRLVDARNDYIQVLQREPHHLVALNNLGSVLMATGHRSAARIAYKEATVRHPDDPISRVNLGNFLVEEAERLTVHGKDQDALQAKQEAREHFEHALRLNPNHEKGHEGLSYILSDLGDSAEAEWHRQKAFEKRAIIPMPYRGSGTPIRVLQLTSTTGGNVRLQKFLDEKIFQTFVITTEFFDPKTPLPAHSLVINSIGDTEVSARALVAAQSVLALTTAPVINHPAAVLSTSRSDVAKRLSQIPGVVTPLTATLSREELSASPENTLARRGFGFPILLRAPGFHTGQHFVKVETADALPAALAEIPTDNVIVIQYLDARGRDGKTRKYRTMMIDGQLYPLHCAISSNWKIHYFTAEMADNPDHRAEDASFLENMPTVIGPKAINALKEIQHRLALDYAGIDFGLNEKKEVLVFEANATMVVNPPEPDPRWSYRMPAYKNIENAILKMFTSRAGARNAIS
jgi:glutamate/tyrosine decarboxylase-like PLP-dependent enzyme/glutathione synthase/RimK-type ligase-like ATP-grasp enzyme